MKISKKKFKKLAEKHLVAIEKPRNEFGRNEIKIYGIEELYKAINVIHCCKSDSEQLNVSFNVGDKVLFDNKKAVVLWTSVNYLDIEIVGTNKILQGVHTSKVLPR